MAYKKSLGRRLNAIFSMVQTRLQSTAPQVNIVWDCYCDHGQLGFHLLDQTSVAKVYFVDTLPHLTKAIDDKLKRFAPSAAKHRYRVFNQAVESIAYSEHQTTESSVQLLLMAGVGGLTIIQHLEKIITEFERNVADQNQRLEFVLCLMNDQFAVREYLLKSGFILHQEEFVSERGRFYELLQLSYFANSSEVNVGVMNKGLALSLAGGFWCLNAQGHVDDSEQQLYLEKLLKLHRSRKNTAAIAVYQPLLASFST